MRWGRIGARAAGALLAGAALVLAPTGCRDDGRSDAGGRADTAADTAADTLAAADGRTAVSSLADVTHAVQLAALADSMRARTLADSLAAEGWMARVEPAAVAGRRVFRVQVLLAGGEELARHVAHALATGGAEAVVVTGAAPGARAPGRSAHVVNHGTHGMAARTRWVLSPDRRAILAVEDPTAVENDPLPNAFVLAGPGDLLVQRDSVWDVAPSPDWTRLAYSRAYISPPGERDSLTAAEWRRLAARAGLALEIVRRAAFPTSGMTYAVGVARPFVVSLDGRPGAAGAGLAAERTGSGAASVGPDTVTRALPVAGGWRLRWTRDGTRLGVGAAPARIADDADATAWRYVDPASGAERGPGSTDSLAATSWAEGPTLDISVRVDAGERRILGVNGRTIESQHGWIRVRGGSDTGDRQVEMVGPGVALAATADGEIVVALAPNPRARSYEATHHLVVYRIAP